MTSIFARSRCGVFFVSQLKSTLTGSSFRAAPYRIPPIHATKPPLYKKLVYCDVFNNIDLVISSNNSAVKYSYVIKPGADPIDIENIFTGQTSLSTSGGNLLIGTQVEDIVWPQAKAYEMDNAGNIIPLSWQPEYDLTGNVQSFSFGPYDNNHFLVFEISFNACSDDVVVNDNNDWGTFYSGSLVNDKNFNDIKNDASNNTFVTGYTKETDFPVQNGFQTSNAGDRDAFLIKFDDSAIRKFATYFGGNSEDVANAVETGPDGKIYIVGATRSKSNSFPLADNGVSYHDDINSCPFSSCSDAFIVAFNSNGIRNFATFYGLGDINVDKEDRAYDIKIVKT